MRQLASSGAGHAARERRTPAPEPSRSSISYSSQLSRLPQRWPSIALATDLLCNSCAVFVTPGAQAARMSRGAARFVPVACAPAVTRPPRRWPVDVRWRALAHMRTPRRRGGACLLEPIRGPPLSRCHRILARSMPGFASWTTDSSHRRPTDGGSEGTRPGPVTTGRAAPRPVAAIAPARSPRSPRRSTARPFPRARHRSPRRRTAKGSPSPS